MYRHTLHFWMKQRGYNAAMFVACELELAETPQVQPAKLGWKVVFYTDTQIGTTQQHTILNSTSSFHHSFNE
jgi:hypothetical protein